MDDLASELNEAVISANPNVFEMLSSIGKEIFFPKGILSQAAEAKVWANRINASIGIARESGRGMYLKTLTSQISNMESDEALTYAPSFGIPALRSLWQKNLYIKNPSTSVENVSLPLVTCGITHGISVFSDIWLDPEDLVIMPDMAWGNYNMIFSVRKKVKLSTYSMFSNEGRFNLIEFTKTLERESHNNEKITILLNFPHNPTGYSLYEEEAFKVAEVLERTAQAGTKIIAVCDDAYFGLFYGKGVFKQSLFSILSSCHDRLLAVKLDGSSKEDFAWGLRVGFITYACSAVKNKKLLHHALEMKTAGCIRATISNASHLSQTLLLKSLENKESNEEKRKKFVILKNRAQIVKKTLENEKFFAAWDSYPFNSGYFMCIKLKTVNANDLRVHLLKKYGVGLISVREKDIRIAFSCVDASEIFDLFELIFQGIKDLESKYQK